MQGFVSQSDFSLYRRMTDECVTEQEATVLAYLKTAGDLGIREAFREIDLSDTGSNVYKFKVPANGEPTNPIPEGEKMPRKGSTHQCKEVRFEKFGFEVTEDADDEDIEDQVEMLNATLASQAANEVYDHVRVSWASSDRLDIVETAIKEVGSTLTYADQKVVIVPQVLGEAIASEDPTRDWEELREDFEDSYSVRIITDPFNVLRGSDVLIANTDFFGYEATRTYPETNSYVEYEEHNPARQIDIPEDERTVINEVTQAYMRKGFVVMDDDAAHIVRFGRV